MRDLGARLAGRVADRVLGPRAVPPVAPVPNSRPGIKVVAPSGAKFPEECRPVDLDALRLALGPGRRLRVVNHWASWCAPCVEEIPLLVALHLQLEDRADFIGICWEMFDDDRPLSEVAERVANFASVRAVRYPSLLVTASPEAFFEALDLPSQKIPQTWVVGRDGTVLRRWEGALDEESAAELARFVEGSCGGVGP